MKNLLALGTERGVFILKPGKEEQADWAVAAQGLAEHPVRGMVLHPDGSLLAGATNAMVYRTSDGFNYKPLYEGIKYTAVFSLSLHPQKPEVLFCGTTPAAIFKSTDSGATWRQMEAFNQVPGRDTWTYYHAPYAARVRFLLHHPHEPDVVFAGIEVGGLVATLDGGRTWMPRHGGLGRDINQLAIHPAAAGRIYAVSDSGFYRSDDLGGTWTLSVKGIPYTFCECLALDPKDPNRLMVGVNQVRDSPRGACVFRSSDAGESWQVTSSGLPSMTDRYITALASTGPGQFVVGTNKGDIFASLDFGEKWRRLDANLPHINTILPLPWQAR